jgi:hypothetical protein
MLPQQPVNMVVMTVFYSDRHNERTWESEHRLHPDWEILVNADRSYPVYGVQFCGACEDGEKNPDHASCAGYTTQIDPEWCECQCWVTWQPSWKVSTDIKRLP